MKIYKVIEDAAQIKKLQPGRSTITSDNRDEVKQSVLKNIDLLVNLKAQLQATPNFNGWHYFFVEYTTVVSKSKRLQFDTPVNSINLIPQIGSRINENNHFKIYYKIPRSDFESQINKISQLITNDSDSLSDKLLENFLSLREILRFGFDTFPSSSNNIAVRVLPIIEIINIIKADNLFEFFNENSFLAVVSPDQLEEIQKRFPGFIYATEDLKPLVVETINLESIAGELILNGPNNDIVIGVIDSGIDENSPFISNVLSIEDHRENKKSRDLKHGTMVTSLIIANDELNPDAKDNLGNFNTKHFELLTDNGCSFAHASKKLEEIVSSNTDIKIWNISFGSLKTPYYRSIDAMGMILDNLSKRFNVLFVVAAGNEREDAVYENLSLNTPADSLNSLSVGSVFHSKTSVIKRTNYSSFGPILHYEKPEISHFGGPNNKSGSKFYMYFNGFIEGEGTSFSTPRVTRLAAHYFSNGYTIEQVKAKIISLTIRETKNMKSSSFGWVDSDASTIGLLDERTLFGKQPRYIPIELPKNTKNVKLSASHIVEPFPNLGEEYSIDNVEISLVWADKNFDEFERDYKKKTVGEKGSESHEEFLTETDLRMESGKYFNSKLANYSIERIKEYYELAKNKLEIENLQLFIRVRKLSLYDIEDRSIKVGLVYSFEGDFSEKDFEELNSSIIEIEQTIDIDAD